MVCIHCGTQAFFDRQKAATGYSHLAMSYNNRSIISIRKSKQSKKSIRKALHNKILFNHLVGEWIGDLVFWGTPENVVLAGEMDGVRRKQIALKDAIKNQKEAMCGERKITKGTRRDYV